MGGQRWPRRGASGGPPPPAAPRCRGAPPKGRCCGGMLLATGPEVAREWCLQLIDWARERGANCIVTVCPLCQANLDLLNLGGGKDGSPDPLPVLYFTQLIGLA